MPEPTLTAVFGAGASQTSTQLIISKADLPGLTASATNTAESLLVGLVLKAETALTEANQATNVDQSIRIARGDESITTDFETNTKYLENPFTITARRTYTSAGIDPDNY